MIDHGCLYVIILAVKQEVEIHIRNALSCGNKRMAKGVFLWLSDDKVKI